jgi:hypothetical protein
VESVSEWSDEISAQLVSALSTQHRRFKFAGELSLGSVLRAITSRGSLDFQITKSLRYLLPAATTTVVQRKGVGFSVSSAAAWDAETDVRTCVFRL